MTKTEIDVMWSRALREAIEGGEEFTRYRFAAMVASAEREAEREACARICETEWSTTQEHVHGLALADMIRDRAKP
jgi:hypothetical protein